MWLMGFSFLGAFAGGLLFVPLARWFSVKVGLVSQPRKDRWGGKAVAKAGGVAIFSAFLLSVGFIGLTQGNKLGATSLRWELLLGPAVMFCLGLLDDFKHLSPPAKLIGQILTAALVIFLGYTTGFFSPRIPNNIVAQLPNILLTFIWLVGITNAVNLLDNMDGLAGGIAFITAGILGFFFWQSGDMELLLVTLALAGSILAFLVFNFPPASIFMGDSGSLFLGFTLALLAIVRQPQASNVFAIIGVPTLLFLLPILDTILVTVTRLLRGQSPAQGGRDHTSHRLIAFGLSERQAVLALYSVGLAAGVLAAVLESIEYWFSLVLVPGLVITLALLSAYLGKVKVISEPKKSTTGQVIQDFLMDLAYRRRIFEVILDFFLSGLAYYLALLTGFGLIVDSTKLAIFLQQLPLVLAGVYLAFFLGGVYRGVWRYFGIEDLVRFGRASLLAGVLAGLAMLVTTRNERLSLLVVVLFPVFLFTMLVASRSSFLILDIVFQQQRRRTDERVVILGAGDAGEAALRWMLANPELGYSPVAFLDTDPFLTGRFIHGLQVWGGLDKLAVMAVREKIQGVVLIPGACNQEELHAVLQICREQKLSVRSLIIQVEQVPVD